MYTRLHPDEKLTDMLHSLRKWVFELLFVMLFDIFSSYLEFLRYGYLVLDSFV